MTDTWYAVVDQNGVLISTGTVLADQATLDADGLSAVPLPAPPDLTNNLWNPATRKFEALQIIDRIQDFIAAHQTFWNTLPTAQQNAIQAAVISLLGSRRYRHQRDPTNL